MYSFHVAPQVRERLTNTLPRNSQKHLEKCLYILSTVHLGYTFHRKEYDLLYSGFAPVNAKLIQGVCGNNYSQHIQWLISNGFLLSDGWYVPQKACKLGRGKSIGYKLHPDIAQLTPAVLEMTGGMAEKVKRVKVKAQYTPQTETEQYLLEQLPQYDISPAALEQIKLEGNRTTDHTLYHAIRTKEHLFERGEKGTRLFTTYGLLKRSLRPFIGHCSGHQLWELDFRNSQPLILCTLFREYFGDDLPADARLYQTLCEGGQLYEHMASLCSSHLTSEDARANFKADMFGLVFYCYHSEKKHPIRDAFKKTFPSVWKLIKHYKKNDYRHLSQLMQQRERGVVIDRICTRLIQATGGTIPLLTIHDSIITTEPFVGVVKAEMLQAMQEYYEIVPTVAAKPLT